jgi:cytochrome b561
MATNQAENVLPSNNSQANESDLFMDMTKFLGRLHDTLGESLSCRVWIINHDVAKSFCRLKVFMNQVKTKSLSRWTHAFQRLWTLHWVMAACFLAIYLVGILMARLPREVIFRGSLYNVHKSMGVLVLGLLVVRIFTLLQVFSKKYLKRKPTLTKQWIAIAALHGFLYCLMLVVPISGIWFSNTGGHDIPFFFIKLPNWFEENRSITKIAESLHFRLAYILLALVVLHVMEQRQFLKRMWRRVVRK